MLKRLCNAVLLMAVACFALSGCAFVPTSRGDIKKHIIESLGHDDFRVALKSEDTEKSHHTWKVHDRKNNIDFCVYDDFYTSYDMLITVGRDVYDDYNYRLMETYGEIPECMTFDGAERAVSFTMTYSNLSELESNCRDMWSFFMKLVAMHENFNFTYDINYDCPGRNMSEAGLAPKYDYSMADVYGHLGKSEKYGYLGDKSFDELYGDARNEYFELAVTYQFEDMMKEMTQDDEQKLREDTGLYHVGVRNVEGKLKFDSSAYGMYDTMTFGNFYVLLKERGFQVEGSPESYVFTAPEGDNYRFSYENFDDGIGTFYIKNDENIAVAEGKSPELDIDEIKSICGLDVEFKNPERIGKMDRNVDYIVY